MSKQMLYVMKNSVGLYKIGVSNNPERRCNQIRLSSGFDVEVVRVFDTVKPAIKIENFLHKHFKNFRMNGEWFKFENFSDSIVMDAIKIAENFERKGKESFEDKVESLYQQIINYNVEDLCNIDKCEELFDYQRDLLVSNCRANVKLFDAVIEKLQLNCYVVMPDITYSKGDATRVKNLNTRFCAILYNHPIVKNSQKNRVKETCIIHIIETYQKILSELQSA